MANINRIPLGHRHKKGSSKASYKEWSKYYNHKSWKDLRNLYLSQHPLCEECERHDRIVPAEEVHHKVFISYDSDENNRLKRLLNYDNLKSLCKTCHKAIHKKADKLGVSVCYELNDEEYEDAHGLKWMK